MMGGPIRPCEHFHPHSFGATFIWHSDCCCCSLRSSRVKFLHRFPGEHDAAPLYHTLLCMEISVQSVALKKTLGI